MPHPVTFQSVDEDDEVLANLLADDFAAWDFELGIGFSSGSGWFPGLPSPSPLTVGRLRNVIVPRVPGLGQDQRLVRFTETVQTILNGLTRTGSIYPSGDGDWLISEDAFTSGLTGTYNDTFPP